MARQPTAKSVDDYIRSFPPETRKALEGVRALIKRSAPGVTERVSYGMATFDLNDHYLVYLAGWKNHISLYPVSASAARSLKNEIKPYLSGKGTLKFPLAEPIPMDLIRRFIQIRKQERATTD